VSGGSRRHLRVKETRIDLRIDARGVHNHQRLEPALRLAAIERMLPRSGRRGPMYLKLAHKLLEFPLASRSQRLLGADAEGDATLSPVREEKPAEAQRNLGCSRNRFGRDRG